MTEYSAKELARETSVGVGQLLSDLGLDPIQLMAEPHGAALAVHRWNALWDRDDIAVLYVSANGSAPSGVVIASGVMHSIQNDATEVVFACNVFNQWHHPVGCVAFAGDDGGDVLVRASFPFAILRDVPAFFHAVMFDVSDRANDARELLSERGIEGEWHQWSDPDLARIIANLAS